MRRRSHIGEGNIDRVRYRRITGFFARVILHLVWQDILLKRLLPARVLASRSTRWRRISRSFRLVAVEMGGVLIKLGQFLSSRVDVLPPEITEELKGLQDEVPAVAAPAILEVLREELGDLTERFVRVEEAPVAAASLGQVHRAWLRSRTTDMEPGVPVVVKVQRPGIERLVETDLAALRVVARWAMHYPPIRRRADLPALMEEFARTLWEELDYRLEADNAERFADMFAGNEGVRIPRIYRHHSTARVLVLEDVEAIKIVDVPAIENAGIDRKEVASRLMDTYFKQIFGEGFFHADPHPGNLFVQPRLDVHWEPGAGPRPFCLTFVDFGMVGRIEAMMGENLSQMLVAVTQRDAWALTKAYRDMGFFLPTADLERIAEAQTILLDELWGRNLLELARPDPEEVRELTEDFKDILYDFPFQVPQDFIYLGRALGMLSGLSTLLDPDINPWYQIEKYGQQIIRSRQARKAGWEAVIESLKPLVALPGQVQRIVSMAEKGTLTVQTSPDRVTLRRLEQMERKLVRIQLSIVAAAGLVSGTLLYLGRRNGRSQREQH